MISCQTEIDSTKRLSSYANSWHLRYVIYSNKLIIIIFTNKGSTFSSKFDQTKNILLLIMIIRVFFHNFSLIITIYAIYSNIYSNGNVLEWILYVYDII